MRRWLAILLLTLLPLQFSWAAVAAYCAHAADAVDGHAGLHTALQAHGHGPLLGDAHTGLKAEPQAAGLPALHADQSPAPATDQAVSDGLTSPAEQALSAGPDADCSHCHCHGGCASLPAPAVGIAPVAQASYPAMPASGLLRTRVQSPPERPQWPPLA